MFDRKSLTITMLFLGACSAADETIIEAETTEFSAESVMIFGQTCEIEEFKDTYFENTTLIESLAIVYQMSESSWNNSNKGLSLNIPVKGVPIGVDYSTMRQRAREIASSYGYEHFSDYSSQIAAAVLNDNGVEAYKACLQRRGLNIYAENPFDNSETELYRIVIWNSPVPNCAKKRLHVSAAENIADKSPVENSIKGLNICEAIESDTALRPSDPYSEASISIKAGGVTKTAWLPPLKSLFAQTSGIIGRSRQVIDVCKPRREGIKVFDNQDLIMELGAGNHNIDPIFSDIFFVGSYDGKQISEQHRVYPETPATLELPDGKTLVVNGSSFKDCTLSFKFSLR